MLNNQNTPATLSPSFHDSITLLGNKPIENITILAQLKRLLRKCTRFDFAVAFVTRGGLILLKNCLKKLEKKGICGRIILSSYLHFTEPQAIADLMHFKNIDVFFAPPNFHAKGYLFQTINGNYDFCIGSANLTQSALKLNYEWCLLLEDKTSAALTSIISSYESLIAQSQKITPDLLAAYEIAYLKNRSVTFLPKESFITPNQMQYKALLKLKALRQKGYKKAILISATGTGKTLLGALDVKAQKAKRLLFIAHREEILNQARSTFKKVFGPNIKMGLLSSREKKLTAPFLFATVNMIAKNKILATLPDDYFDYIIIDETHRAGAKSYLKIFKHFSPHFLLGMTATPARPDNFNILSLYDYNIACQITLQDAIEANLLCPFHYFGISDITSNGIIDENSDFGKLTTKERVHHINEKIRFYGHGGERLRGLVFCRSIEEAEALAEQFCHLGYKSLALSGKSKRDLRRDAIFRLAQQDGPDSLDLIFTVDLFNEGIDIPSVNLIIMLRPTQSPIIFTQQLGRGLRRCAQKAFTVILDFIGNYKNNFMIPIALFGDRSNNKDTLRRLVCEPDEIICGKSSVEFDAISRERIYRSIDQNNLTDMDKLRSAYNEVKMLCGKIPSLSELASYSTISPLVFMQKFGSYEQFLQKYEPNFSCSFSAPELEVLRYISARFASGKRLFELIGLSELLKSSEDFLSRTFSLLLSYKETISQPQRISFLANLSGTFLPQNERAKFSHCAFIEPSDGGYRRTAAFSELLKRSHFKTALTALIDYGISNWQKDYKDTYRATSLSLYKKYSYEDVCWLLNWPHKINPNAMSGYFFEKSTQTLAVFINYIPPEKKRVHYNNLFLSLHCITAYSRRNRSLASPEIKNIYASKERGNQIYLFVRKPDNTNKAKEFYFLGEIEPIGTPEEIAAEKFVKIIYGLKTPVRPDIYDYLTSK